MATLTQLKCACNSCVCMVDSDHAIQRNGQYYCGEACASGHAGGSSGCGHPGCNCHN